MQQIEQIKRVLNDINASLQEETFMPIQKFPSHASTISVHEFSHLLQQMEVKQELPAC
ncbi:hypothetical protein KDI_47200 [Dictyobacter arantiisoli]|uniref:Uncharacterized protein n=1 Tax=Dictyobacter arantiisoli TaxID=2014874 RepID=A0A5A5TJ49_9CHLR|nr:hypothetical protein KDI_47200 [Dictyobacter arantiisoli]